MNKFLLVSDQSNYDIKVPKSIKKEFFQLDDTFLQTDLEDGLSMVRKIGKNDSTSILTNGGTSKTVRGSRRRSRSQLVSTSSFWK